MFAALGAEAVIQGPGGERRMKIASLYRWAGEPLIDKGEYISSIEARFNEESSFSFVKYARWKGDFAEASAAVVLSGTRRRLKTASVVLGAVAPTPYIAARAQSILLDGSIDSDRVRRAAEAVVEGSLPMTRNHYKVSLAVNQAQRAIEMALESLEKK
jgi:xanthine dehydrogenase YagS FAD-binding subunit